jgi:hypothetical protein
LGKFARHETRHESYFVWDVASTPTACATQLLNAGAPVETVQLQLGHERIQTTMGYARVYDGTAAADYYHAMRLVESRLEPPGGTPAPSIAEMLVLVEQGMGLAPPVPEIILLPQEVRERLEALAQELAKQRGINTIDVHQSLLILRPACWKHPSRMSGR